MYRTKLEDLKRLIEEAAQDVLIERFGRNKAPYMVFVYDNNSYDADHADLLYTDPIGLAEIFDSKSRAIEYALDNINSNSPRFSDHIPSLVHYHGQDGITVCQSDHGYRILQRSQHLLANEIINPGYCFKAGIFKDDEPLTLELKCRECGEKATAFHKVILKHYNAFAHCLTCDEHSDVSKLNFDFETERFEQLELPSETVSIHVWANELEYR